MKINTDKELIAAVFLIIILLFLYLKSSNDPIVALIQDTFLESWFLQFSQGNNVIKDLSLGILVSLVFWLFNVYLPQEKIKKAKIERLNKAIKLILEANEGSQFSWDKHYLFCSPVTKKDIATIKNIRSKLSNKNFYNTLIEKTIYEVCSESTETFRFLSLVANEISPKDGALWDSITRNIEQIGNFNKEYHEKKIASGWKLGDPQIDFSTGLLELNLIEMLDKIEQWIEKYGS